MFTFLYEWMQNLAYYLVLVTAFLHMITNSEYKKYVRFFTGLLLVIILIAPVFQLPGEIKQLNKVLQTEELEKQWKEIEPMGMEKEKNIVVEDISVGRANISSEDEREEN